jgi:general secretion pathway protein L
MLSSLITWWKEQMRDLVPASLRSFISRSWRPALVVVSETPDALDVALFLRNRGNETPLGRHRLDDPSLRDAVMRLPRASRATVILKTPQDLLLEQEIMLPLQAEPDLKRVIAYEMDRLTPFRADQVLWTYLIGRRDAVRNRLYLRVTVIPRRPLEALLAALRDAGLIPTLIEAGNTAESRRTIPLTDDSAIRPWLGPRAEAYAMGVCAVLAATAIALPFVQQSIEFSAVDERIEAIRPQVAEAEKLRKAIAGSAATADAITAAHNQVGAPLQTIAVLTEVLPDDTYLTSLSLRQRKLSIAGRSAAAAKLIGAMAAHPLIRNPAFVAPVIRDETNGGQMFSIRSDLGS